MKMNWLRNNRYLLIAFFWTFASFCLALDAMTRTNAWRLGPPILFMGIALVYWLNHRFSGTPNCIK